MSQYNIEARNPLRDDESLLDDPTTEDMWKLFLAICDYWQNVPRPEAMRSSLIVFMNNRIKLNPNYMSEYRNASTVIRELITELGEKDAYKKLFTDPVANMSPPMTKLARVRQLVSNEFIILQLALGGFKAFSSGDGANYPGYFGGPNIDGQPPYRTYTEFKAE